MKKFYLLILFNLLVVIGFAQPVRNWGSYFGGTGGDEIYSVVYDASGNVYIAGNTTSANNISTVGSHQVTPGGAQDAFLAKFNSSGVLDWATYYGGTGSENGRAVAVDGIGNVYLAGYTNSSTAISTVGSHQAVYGGVTDAFLVKFNSSGVRQWGTYYGGSVVENGFSIDIDASNNIYLAGTTTSANAISTIGSFQTTNGGATDAFLVTFNSSGVRQWATYYGGTGIETIPSVCIDVNNKLFLAGSTNSANAISTVGSHQATIGGGQDAFLVQFNNSGAQQWGTYYGGTGNEIDVKIAADVNGNIHLVGQATSTTLATVGAHQAAYGGGTYDNFLVQFNGLGVRQWCTFYGGTGNEYKPAVDVDGNGNIYLSGYTTSSVAISTVGSHQVAHGGGTYEAMLAMFNNSGVRQWGTYHGGTGIDYSYTVAVNTTGQIYIAGTTASTNAVSTVGVHQTVYGGGANDGFLVQFVGCNAAPALPSTITGAATVCIGSSQSYSVTNNPSAFSYTWTLPGGWVGTSTTNSINTTVGASSGNITVTANNPCGSSTVQTLAITVNDIPATPSIINGNTNACNGATEIYDVTNDPIATDYTWTLPGTWSGTSITNSITATVGSAGGNVVVTANNACGSSSSQMAAISVIDILPMPSAIVGNATVCNGVVEGYNVTNNPSASGYTWTLPGAWSGASNTNSISATPDATSGNITVTADNACGSSAAQTLAIITNDVPAMPSSMNGNTTVCNGDAEVYDVTNDVTATSYTWTLPGSWAGTSTTNSINTIAGATSGNINVTANNACGTSAAQSLAITVNDVPAAPSIINGNATACNGSTEVYDVTNDPSATDYTWTLPGTWSGTSTTNTINTTVGSAGGNITVVANNACGSSASQMTTISVIDILAMPSAINGSVAVCNGAVEVYDVTNDPAATGYTWTLPFAWTGASLTNSISATASTTSGDITVTADNACGSSLAQTLTISASDVPATPSAINGNIVVCEGTAEFYDVTNDFFATSYTWTLPGSWIGTSTTNIIGAVIGLTSGNVTVTANNACGSSAVQTLAVTTNDIPLTPSAIGGGASQCVGDAPTYSVTNDPSATYIWTLPGTWTGLSTSNSINTTVGASGGTISVIATNSCGSSAPQTLVVTVNPLPVVTLALATTFTCDYILAFALTGESPSGGTFSGTGVTAGNFDPAIAGLGTHTITYTFTDANTCTNSATDDIVVDACLGVDANESEFGFDIYPNPFSQTFTLVSNSTETKTFVIMNAVGEIVHQSAINNTSMLVDMSDLAPGVYLLIVNDDSKAIVKKIIKN